jgi:hypothetical protein
LPCLIDGGEVGSDILTFPEVAYKRRRTASRAGLVHRTTIGPGRLRLEIGSETGFAGSGVLRQEVCRTIVRGISRITSDRAL